MQPLSGVLKEQEQPCSLLFLIITNIHTPGLPSCSSHITQGYSWNVFHMCSFSFFISLPKSINKEKLIITTKSTSCVSLNNFISLFGRSTRIHLQFFKHVLPFYFPNVSHWELLFCRYFACIANIFSINIPLCRQMQTTGCSSKNFFTTKLLRGVCNFEFSPQ